MGWWVRDPGGLISVSFTLRISFPYTHLLYWNPSSGPSQRYRGRVEEGEGEESRLSRIIPSTKWL